MIWQHCKEEEKDRSASEHEISTKLVVLPNCKMHSKVPREKAASNISLQVALIASGGFRVVSLTRLWKGVARETRFGGGGGGGGGVFRGLEPPSCSLER